MTRRPEILKQPYPEEMRQAGFEVARRCDIEQHKHVFSDVWKTAPIAAEAVG